MGKMKDLDIRFNELQDQLDTMYKFTIKQEIRIQALESTVNRLGGLLLELDRSLEERFRNK